MDAIFSLEYVSLSVDSFMNTTVGSKGQGIVSMESFSQEPHINRTRLGQRWMLFPNTVHQQNIYDRTQHRVL